LHDAYIINGATDALQDWLEIRGIGEDSLFVAVYKGGKAVKK
jgi:hypothetical protein